MKLSKKVTVAASVLLVVCMVGSVAVLRQVDKVRSGATLEDILYVSSPNLVKRLSLGYDGLMADIYWTRAVQYFGSRHAAWASHYRQLPPLLTITTTLDPHLAVAYEFGANFLSPRPPDGAGMPEEAVKLVEFGIHNNPDNWRLYYDLGFIYYMDLKDYARAEDAFVRGSKVPNAHPFLKILGAQMAQHAGDTQMSRALWTTTYQTSQEKLIKGNAIAHLRALQVDDEVTALEQIIARYRETTGHNPTSWSELVDAHLLRETPRDVTGRPYKLMSSGRVEVEFPDDIPFIVKGVPEGYKPPPAKDLEKLAN